jgi:hypothetical protein
MNLISDLWPRRYERDLCAHSPRPDNLSRRCFAMAGVFVTVATQIQGVQTYS